LPVNKITNLKHQITILNDQNFRDSCIAELRNPVPPAILQSAADVE